MTELQKLCKVVDELNGSLVNEGVRTIAKAYYWSSTEGGASSAGRAWGFNFGSGPAIDIFNKYSSNHVRAVRAF